MIVQQALSQARAALAEAVTEDAGLEAELLLRHALGIDQVGLYLALTTELDSKRYADFQRLVARRLKGEPTAYITGHREFFGLDFAIRPGVLVPRPETELLVEKAIELARLRGSPTIVDIGTGCGAIAISLTLNLPTATVYATDISLEALAVARENCLRHGAKAEFVQGDLLEPLPGPADIIVANLPYVRSAELGRLIDFEPRLALDGGQDGLDVIRRLCHQARQKLKPGGGLLLEIGLGQSKPVLELLRQQFLEAAVAAFPDLAGIDRVVTCLTSKAACPCAST